MIKKKDKNYIVFFTRRIEFGKQEACNLIVVVSDKHIAVWNILSLSIMWSVSLNVTKLTADPKSIYMAAFTVDNTCKYYHFL